jgi:glycosyltransferase involved in cell wall biosynthesis
MPSLDIIIAARNEQFLNQTLKSILKTRADDTSVIVLLDGEVYEEPIEHESITVIRNQRSIGQRACINLGASISKAKYVMKLDAHCTFQSGFDKILMSDCDYDTTVIPFMYNLHAFNWVCPFCSHALMQGPEPKHCASCEQPRTFVQEIIWKPKIHKKTEFYNFDENLRFQYWNEYRKRDEAQGHKIVELMANIGACFMMQRERYYELGGLDEKHGSWGQVGIEISCKSWLSGGRQIVNRNAWFSHLFRTQVGFSFPYINYQEDTNKAREYSKDLWLNNKWSGQKRNLSWLVSKFWPVPGWTEIFLNQINKVA